MIQKLKKNILEMIFPSRCINCGALGDFVCSSCREKIVKIKKQSCPLCHRITNQGRLCPTCRPKTKMQGVVALGYFHDPIIKEAIHKFKYDELAALDSALAEMLSEVILEQDLEIDIVAAVPTSRKNRNERGYNQADLLAHGLALNLKLPKFTGLIKRKHTKHQVGLKRRERMTNLRDAFEVKNSNIINDKNILLVDDVLTTGTTLNECARALREAGARKIWGAVLARE